MTEQEVFDAAMEKAAAGMRKQAEAAGVAKPQIGSTQDAMPRVWLTWVNPDKRVRCRITMFMAHTSSQLLEPHVNFSELRVWVTDESGRPVGRMTESSEWTLLPGQELEEQVAEYISAAQSVTAEDIMAENEIEEMA